MKSGIAKLTQPNILGEQPPWGNEGQSRCEGVPDLEGKMVRRMADAHFRAQQECDRYAQHVRSINEFVDVLRGDGRGWMPHVAPCHGGVEARMLSVLRDPGPKTQASTGSGFLCVENDDPTAELQCVAFASVGIESKVLHTYHPGRQALWTPDPAVRQARQQARLETYARAADLLGRRPVSA